MSTRMVYCVSITDKTKKYPDELCDFSSRPINEKNCSSDVLCPPMWHASQWSKVRQDAVTAFTWALFDFPFNQLLVCRSAYHLNGKSGYSAENSNGTIHYQSQASSREKAKNLPVLVHGTTQSHIFCFQFEKIPVQHFTANFHGNFLPNAPGFGI